MKRILVSSLCTFLFASSVMAEPTPSTVGVAPAAVMPVVANPSAPSFVKTKRVKKTREDCLKTISEIKAKLEADKAKIKSPDNASIVNAAMECIGKWEQALKDYKDEKVKFGKTLSRVYDLKRLAKSFIHKKAPHAPQAFPDADLSQLKARMDDVKAKSTQMTLDPSNKIAFDTMISCLDRFFALTGELKGKNVDFHRLHKYMLKMLHTAELFVTSKVPAKIAEAKKA